MLKYFENLGCSHSFTFFTDAAGFSSSISISSFGSLSNTDASTPSRIIACLTDVSGNPFFNMLKYLEYFGCSHNFTLFTADSGFSSSISTSSFGSLSNTDVSTPSRIIACLTEASGKPFFNMLKYLKYFGCSHNFTFFTAATLPFSSSISTSSFGSLSNTDESTPSRIIACLTPASGTPFFSMLKYFAN